MVRNHDQPQTSRQGRGEGQGLWEWLGREMRSTISLKPHRLIQKIAPFKVMTSFDWTDLALYSMCKQLHGSVIEEYDKQR